MEAGEAEGTTTLKLDLVSSRRRELEIVALAFANKRDDRFISGDAVVVLLPFSTDELNNTIDEVDPLTEEGTSTLNVELVSRRRRELVAVSLAFANTVDVFFISVATVVLRLPIGTDDVINTTEEVDPFTEDGTSTLRAELASCPRRKLEAVALAFGKTKEECFTSGATVVLRLPIGTDDLINTREEVDLLIATVDELCSLDITTTCDVLLINNTDDVVRATDDVKGKVSFPINVEEVITDVTSCWCEDRFGVVWTTTEELLPSTTLDDVVKLFEAVEDKVPLTAPADEDVTNAERLDAD